MLTATHAWAAWYTALVFGLWFLALLAWADAFQTRLPWQASLVVGLNLFTEGFARILGRTVRLGDK